MNIHKFLQKKESGEKISMITCYDYWSAQIIADSDIDCILVGDSLAMVMHGHKTTLPASVDLMVHHVSAVSRGAGDKFIVGDLPFMSYRKNLTDNMDAIEKIMQAGAHAVKLEGVDGNESLISHTVKSGVPVMGHIGLTPQSVYQLGGFKVQGRSKEAAELLRQQALKLQEAGCFSLVFECVPSAVAAAITKELEIPSIGIGAGPDTDGQVLVLQDMLGTQKGFKPKFLRQFLDGHQLIKNALNSYHEKVVTKTFPSIEESYE